MKQFVVGLILCILAAAAAQSVDENGWYFNQETDPFNDATHSIIAKEADVSPTYYTGIIYIRCNADATYGTIDIYINLDTYIGSDDTYRSLHRFDDLDPVTSYWGASTEGDSVFLPHAKIPSFITNMRESEELAFRTWDYDETPLTYLFDLTGVADVLDRLHCDLP